ncbi:hypothetical protein CHS0354_016990 [Potamilus streckersoni]|uniref:Roundabout homolog 1-like n=1 Tax=Potamilus streckersoni TaxID=2493646 RepID=A0AAE0VS45_9BIVA|nr:hypothetical protein CHS0354_016990 [Potamilus streckersoni]
MGQRPLAKLLISVALWCCLITSNKGEANPQPNADHARGSGPLPWQDPFQTNPRITEHPQDDYFAKNEPATLNCKAEGLPLPIITWYRNGELVETNRENPMSHRMLLDNGQLFFLRVIHTKSNKPDVGVYYCNATNVHGTAISRNATIKIASLRDEFRQEPTDTTVAVGKPVTLYCLPPRGEPEPKVFWRKDGDIVQPDSRIELQEAGTLVISSVRKSDTGEYQCFAINKGGERNSKTAQLRIVDVPMFQKMPKDMTAEEGDTVEFQCDVQGDRPLTIQWKKEGGVIRYGGARILPDHTLRIEKIEASDDGVYVCMAENAAGSTKAIARLTVLYAPSFLIRPRDQIVAPGRTVTLQCVATGNPPPTVFWSKGLQESLMFPNRENGRYSVAEDGTFRIERAQKSDEGTYICEALNTRGQASAMVRIEVRADGEFPNVAHDSRPPPIIRYGPDNQTLPTDTVAMLRCQATGDPEPIIRWYKDGRPLMKDLRYALLDSGTLQISDLKISDSGRYTCKAMSEIGEAAWDCMLIVEVQSTLVAFHRAPDIATLPSSPSKPVISDVTDTSVHLSWQPGSSPGGSSVFAFQVEYFGHGTTDTWKVSSSNINTESYTVQELQLNTTYLFVVRAKNSQGLGPPSPPSELVRTLATRDQRTFHQSRVDLPRQEIEARLQGTVIEIVEGEAVNSSAIKIEWRLLKGQDIVDGFYVRYKHILDIRHKQYGEMKIERVPYSQTSYTITGLSSYNWYEICVMAYCQNVQSRCSNPLKVQTEESVFSEPPDGINIHKQGDTGLSLEWKPPNNGPPGDVLSYKIHCFSEDGAHNCSKTVNGTVLRTTINDLEAGKRYRLKMAATTKRGMGQYSHTYMYSIGDQPYIVDKPQGSPDTTTIGTLTQGSEHADLMKEPWFIGVLIGTIGGTLWLVLCVFSVWMCKKKKQKKKMKEKRYYTGEPKHKIGESSNMLYGNYGTKDPNLHCTNDLGLSPELNAFLQGKKEVGTHDDNIYNTAGSSSFPELKTFYQKADPVAPYATTTLIESQNIIRQRTQGMDHMFRPINHGYIPCSEGSADSCHKPDVASSDSNTDNSRPNTSGPQDGSDPMQSPTSDSGSHTTDENGLLLKHRKKTNSKLGPNKQTTVNWAELLPPPPEHPPPSEMDFRGGNPPPTYSEVHGDDRANLNRSPISPVSFSKLSACSCPVPHSQTPVSSWNMPVYSDNECPRCQSEKYFDMRPYTPRQYIQRTQSPRTPTLNSGPSRTCGVYSHNHSPRGNNVNHSQPTRGTPTNYNSSTRGTTPSRGSQSDQESNIPCFQQYRIVPQREDFRFFSDSQWGPGPAPPAPPCQQCVDPSNIDPSRGPDGSSVDRACQSSLSSLVGDQSCLNNSLYHPNRSGQNNNPNLERYQDSPVSEDADYATESDMEVTRCQEDPNDDHWATITDQCNTDCSSVRSSTCSSGDGSFLTEADFASAVARAAEMSGLTVVGTTVCDLNPKSKKERRQRRPARPISPGYSTDSNYGSIDIVHRPYPKSQRKKQLLEQGKRPSQKEQYMQREGFSRGLESSYQENSHPTEVPYYSKPSFPAVLTSPMDISKLSPLGRKTDLPEDGSTFTDSGKQLVAVRRLEDNV